MHTTWVPKHICSLSEREETFYEKYLQKKDFFLKICIANYCEINFYSKENIVTSMLNARMPKNKGQYEWFKYYNNQWRKKLEWVKIEAFFKKSEKKQGVDTKI